MTRDELFLQAAIRKELLSRAEADEALAASQRDSRPVADVLIERGVLTPRTVTVLVRDVERAQSDPTLMVPPPGGSDAATLPTPAGADSSAMIPTVVNADPDATQVAAPGSLPAQPSSEPERLGEFVVVERLGEGGMGTVFRARQVSLEREVALKVVSPKIAGDPEMRQRFLREAKVAASINHPHVITIHQVGEDDGRVFMAMELVTGGDAEDLAEREGGVLSERRALEVIRDCAKGLGAIERAGLVHRDIKPANLFLTADGSAKLADLGLARSQAGDDRVTQSGVVVGTPAYMAPEQAEGHEVDVRTDVYALGASLYRLCVGEPPYTGGSALRVMTKVLNDPVPDPRRANPKLSQSTAALIRTCLAKSPEGRFPSADALLGALEDALAGPPAVKPVGFGTQRACVLLTLFMLAACFMTGGMAIAVSGGEKSGEALHQLESAATVSLEAIPEGSGRICIEAVVAEADLFPAELLAEDAPCLYLETVRQVPDRMDEHEQAVLEEFRLGSVSVHATSETRYMGLVALGSESLPDGGRVIYTGIPAERPVTIVGVVFAGQLNAELISTDLSKADLVVRSQKDQGQSAFLGCLCFLIGVVGLILAFLLARR